MSLSFQQLLSRISFRQLQVFQAVYQQQGYRKAAETLGLTQPAVSSQMRKLEDALEQRLFEYVGRQLYCTRAGEHVAKHISAMFQHVQQLQNDLQSLKGQLSGELNLCVVSSAQSMVPYLVKEFLNAYPEVKVNLKVMNRSQVIEQLNSNTDDLVIMSLVPGSYASSSLPFLSYELIPVVSAGHVFAERKQCSTQTFLDAGLLIREAGSGSRLALEQHCQQYRLNVKPIMQLASNEAIKHAVLSGLGVAVLPKLAVLSELKSGVLKTITIKGFPLRRSWCLLHPAGKHLSPIVKAFMSYVQFNLKEINESFKQIEKV